MYYSDKPIQRAEDDELGVAGFSKQLANSLYGMSLCDPFVVGLYGAWGTGKTSILNLVEHELKSLSEQAKEGEKVITMRFEPWNYSASSQLVEQFFIQLSDALNFLKDENVRTVGKALTNYSSVLKLTSLIPSVGVIGEIATTFLKATGQVLQDSAEGSRDIREKKEQVANALREQHNRIIVMIDDIDRLPDDQIRMIFQLVAAVAGFPNMAYVLAFDKTIVSKAIGNMQSASGQEYLDKIIQVPFELPEIDKEKIKMVFLSRLMKLEAEFHGAEVSEDYKKSILDQCTFPYISTIRDVARVLNTVSLKIPLVGNEVNLYDLAAITTLQVMKPVLFHWIQQNRLSLAGSLHLDEAFSLGFESDKIGKRCIDDLKKAMGEEDFEQAKNTLQVMFPAFSNRIGGECRPITDAEIRRQKRITHPERFEIYTQLSLEKIPISSTQMHAFLTDMPESSYPRLLVELKERGNLESFLFELQAHRKAITKERITEIVKFLFINIEELIPEEKEEEVLSGEYYVMQNINTEIELLEMLDEEERTAFLTEMFSNSDVQTFHYISQMMFSYERREGRIKSLSKGQPLPDPSETLRKLEETFLLQMNELYPEKQAAFLPEREFDIERIAVWRIAAQEDFCKVLDSVMNDPEKSKVFLEKYDAYTKQEGAWHFAEKKILHK